MGAKAITPAFGDPFFEEQLARYHFALPYAKERSALDVGSGTGFGTCALSTVAFEVTGVESDLESVEFAKKHYAHPRIEFVTDDLLTLKSVRKKFDVVTAFGTLDRIKKEQHDEFLKHLAARVHLQGVAVLGLRRSGLSAFAVKELMLRHFCEVQMLGQFKSRGAIGDLLMRLGLVGEAKTKPATHFEFEPLMYWRPEVGWGESGQFVFAPSLWKKAESLIAVCRIPKSV